MRKCWRDPESLGDDVECRVAGGQVHAAEQWEGRSETDCGKPGLPSTENLGFFLRILGSHWRFHGRGRWLEACQSRFYFQCPVLDKCVILLFSIVCYNTCRGVGLEEKSLARKGSFSIMLSDRRQGGATFPAGSSTTIPILVIWFAVVETLSHCKFTERLVPLEEGEAVLMGQSLVPDAAKIGCQTWG